MGGSLLHIPWPLCGQRNVVVAQPVSSQEWLVNEAQNGEPTGVGSKSMVFMVLWLRSLIELPSG